MEIGEKIRRLRIRKNLTQEELANRCELSKGFISQLEHDLSSPSIATLTDILESLGTNLKEFFNDSGNDLIVFKKETVSIQEKDELGHEIHWIVPNAQKNIMEPILIKLKSGGQSDVYGPHAGEVFGFVMQGSIKIHLSGDSHRVRTGEGFYYAAKWAYYIENISTKESIVIWVTSPPNF